MRTESLKLELINWLSGLNDKKLLESLFSIKESVESGDWYLSLNENQKESLKRGIEDHKQGKYLTSKEFWSGYDIEKK